MTKYRPEALHPFDVSRLTCHFDPTSWGFMPPAAWASVKIGASRI